MSLALHSRYQGEDQKLEVKFSTIPKAVEYLGEICHDMCLLHNEHYLLLAECGRI